MNAWLLFLVGVIYVAVAIDYARQANFGMALAFLAYALANVGFIIATRAGTAVG